MLKEKLNSDLLKATKAGNVLEKETIRAIKAKILEEEKKDGKELDDSKITLSLRQLIRQRNNAIEEYTKLLPNNPKLNETISSLNEEKKIIEFYLPTQMPIEEVRDVIKNIILINSYNEKRHIGSIKKDFEANFPNRVDGKNLSQIIMEELGI